MCDQCPSWLKCEVAMCNRIIEACILCTAQCNTTLADCEPCLICLSPLTIMCCSNSGKYIFLSTCLDTCFHVTICSGNAHPKFGWPCVSCVCMPVHIPWGKLFLYAQNCCWSLYSLLCDEVELDWMICMVCKCRLATSVELKHESSLPHFLPSCKDRVLY